MFLSYLITTHNETNSLDKLLSKIISCLTSEQEIVVIDDNSTNPITLEIFSKYKNSIILHHRDLNKNYGAQKNYGIENCKGKWIFQLDADEYPTDPLLFNIKDILELNNKNEVIWLPRINLFSGLTEQDVKMWGWVVTNGMVNFPDYQSRLYKNAPHIRYKRRLHEKVEGFNEYTFMPPQTDFAIVHEKTMEKQRQTNLKYNELFTEEENRGYQVK